MRPRSHLSPLSCGYVPSTLSKYRAVGRSENPGVPDLFGGHNLPHLVEIGLTDLSKSGGAPGDDRPEVHYTILQMC